VHPTPQQTAVVVLVCTYFFSQYGSLGSQPHNDSKLVIFLANAGANTTSIISFLGTSQDKIKIAYAFGVMKHLTLRNYFLAIALGKNFLVY
jgi:hypothetical protein